MSAIEILEIPDRASLVEGAGGTESSWKELRARLPKLAGAIPFDCAERGVVGIQGENGLATLLTIMSVIEAGGIPAPFAPAISTDIRDACLKRLGARGIWTSEKGWASLDGGSSMPRGFELIMHSSGSTGLPKPIAILLSAMRDNARAVGRFADLKAADVHIGTMSHCYMSGIYNATILPLVLGAKSVSIPVIGATNIDVFIDAVRRYRPSIIWLNPLLARMVTKLSDVPGDLFRSCRRAISCTAPLSTEAKLEFKEKFDCELLQSYGLSETLITTLEDPAAPAAGTVGRPIGALGAVRLDDQGQIVIANSGLCAGYLDPKPAADSISSVEFFATGDTGAFDGYGNLIMTGRLSETIHRDGIKFSPERVEYALQCVPAVEEAAVVGYPDPKRGDAMVAFVLGHDVVPGRLYEAIAGQLKPHEIPDRIEVVSAFPRTQSGKIDRSVLKKVAREGHGNAD